MRALTKLATEFWIASAFISQSAADDILGVADTHHVTVRLITGTFCNQTRKKTFAQLLKRAKAKAGLVLVRVWDCGRHRRFHGKVYVWRLRGDGAVAWIGSANLTDGGLQEDGEVLLELRAPWDSPTMRVIRGAFKREWDRGEPISNEFLTAYRESKRVAPDMRLARRHRRGRVPRRRAVRPLLVTSVQRLETESVAERVEVLLGGAARDWIRASRRAYANGRPGDSIFIASEPDRRLVMGEISDVKRDGRAFVVAYDPHRPNGVRWSRKACELSTDAGLALHARRPPRTRWIDGRIGQTLRRAVFKLR
jgi:HKD family nuclease